MTLICLLSNDAPRMCLLTLTLELLIGHDVNGLFVLPLLSDRDNGCGFDPTGIAPGHSGLSLMRDHLQSISASLETTSEPNIGNCFGKPNEYTKPHPSAYSR
jgi:hypothetical protein